MGEPNWKNRTLFHGDNLELMRAMNSNSVDLIATDPPFNKGKDFHATPDSLAKGASFQDRWSWERDVHEAWLDEIKNDREDLILVIENSRQTYGDDMGAFLCFMAVRLMAMERLLKPTGSIYLHCDPTASHYLKMVMDAIFGRKRFQAEITWQRTSSHNDRVFGNVCDTILFYGSAPVDTTDNRLPLNPEYVQKHYRHKDARGVWRSHDLTGPRTSSGESGKPWRGYDPASYGGRCWSVPKTGEYAKYIDERLAPGYLKVEGIHARLDFLDEHNLIMWPRKANGFPSIKRYLIPNQGRKPTNLLTDIPPLSKSDKERVGYPTQKPCTLYERIIRASSKEGDVVLDPFAGCATTCVAAEKLKRQWVGIDIWPKVQDVVVERLASEGLTAPKYTRKTPQAKAQYLWAEELYFTDKLPTRTDDGETAAPFLRVKSKLKADEVSDGLTNRQRKQKLLDTKGPICQGCGMKFHDERHLELDHNTPRADGGSNNLSNRILLCGPCNRLKSHRWTLSGLIEENKKRKYMVDLQLVDALRKH